MKKKYAFTLLEIMIVIFLIGLIGSVVGYNMKGSLDEGKAFKTKQAMIRLSDIFELEMAKTDKSAQEIVDNKMKVIEDSHIVKNPSSLLKDGWGKDFVLEVDSEDDELILISSAAFEKYENKKKSKAE